MSCGGHNRSSFVKDCYSLQNNHWTKQAAGFSKAWDDYNLSNKALIMSTGTFVLGDDSSQVWKKGSAQWSNGPTPHQSGTFHQSCAAKINKYEFLVMGGFPADKFGKKVFKYNVIDKRWTPLHDMRTSRNGHACALFQEGSASYVVVTGGKESGTGGKLSFLSSTDLYYLNGTVIRGIPLEKKRYLFGLAFVEHPIPRLFAIGGHNSDGKFLNDIEIWDKNQVWKPAPMKLKHARDAFGHLVVPKSMVPDCKSMT